MSTPQGHNNPRIQENPENSSARKEADADKRIDEVMKTGEGLSALGRSMDIVGQTNEERFTAVNDFLIKLKEEEKGKKLSTKEQLASKGFSDAKDMYRFKVEDFYDKDGVFDRTMATHPAFLFLANVLTAPNPPKRGEYYDIGTDVDGALIICRKKRASHRN